MHSRVKLVFIAAVLLIGGLVFVQIGLKTVRSPAGPAATGSTTIAAGKVIMQDPQLASEEGDTNRMLRVSPGQVLAMVNGHQIKLGDLIPLRGPNAQAFSRQTYNFLLQRAVDRELVLQTAKAQGLAMTDGEKRQLANTRSLRALPEPGQVQRLTLDQAQLDFEMRDAEAFLLQSALMAGAGVSANVTPEQVSTYYQAHAAEFGDLPPDAQARKIAWAQIDSTIRQRLAAPIRSIYQNQLLAYMKQLQSSADISVTQFADP
jgi:hypothetical protein